MAVIFITSLTGDASVTGSIYNCLSEASDGDIIELSPLFKGSFHYLEWCGELLVNKSLTINPSGGRFICFSHIDDAPARILRIAGASSSPLSVKINNLCAHGFTSTGTAAGSIVNNYAETELTRCVFGPLSNGSSTTGIYSSNGAITLSRCVIYALSGYAVNFASSSTMTADSCTFIGTVKSGGTLLDCATVYPDDVPSVFPAAELFNFGPADGSAIASGRSEQIDGLFYDSIPVGGAVGALGVFPELTATLMGEIDAAGAVRLSGGDGITRPLYLTGGADILGMSKDEVFTAPAGTEQLKATSDGGNLKSVPIVSVDDADFYRACFMSIDIPAFTLSEMAAIIPNFTELFKPWHSLNSQDTARKKQRKKRK